MEHPIVIPPHIEVKLIDEAPRFRDGGAARERWLIQRAAQLGADQRLEDIAYWLVTGPYGASIVTSAPNLVADLRAVCSPKPPSLKQRIAAAIVDGDERTALLLLDEAMPDDCI